MKRILLHTALFQRIRLPAVLLTVICAATYSQTNMGSLIPLTWFKVFTTAFLLYFVSHLHRDKFYYYHNLHISKKALLLSALATDVLLYIAALFIVHEIAPPIAP
ncbi:MAG: hypothetical protein H3C54_10505 [Taibaiella sp.]|nr:hypothetical protein [Taibaiella sp.]